MLRKIVIILAVGALIVIGMIVYLTRTPSTHNESPEQNIMTLSGTNDGDILITQSGNIEHTVMHTGSAIQAGSGVTVTISTNGPPVRDMTPEELKTFQKMMQEK